MANYYLLWASGEDRPGLVATVTKLLFVHGGNLEDSAMMRLGAEFAMFLIFTTAKSLSEKMRYKMAASGKETERLTIGIKALTAREARFVPAKKLAFLISVHGPDRPGIVYRLTEILAKHRFNITDLSTHRTRAQGAPGYIAMIEGYPLGSTKMGSLKRDLKRLSRRLKTVVTINRVSTNIL